MRPITTLFGVFLALSSVDLVFAKETETQGANVAALSPPADPLQAQVFRTFETHCAACHQIKSLDGPPAAGNFGNVLALDEMARAPHLVQAGNPDGSRLLAYLIDRRHPRASNDAPAATKLSSAEIAAVHQWIEQLPASGDSCPGRSVLAPRDVDAAIRSWLAAFSQETARDTRFVTLAHIANECAPGNELTAHRAAIGKILNSLSWSKAPIKPQVIDKAGTVLAVRLSELGWDAPRWDRLAGAQLEGTAFRASPELADIVGAARPAIRGDWLAHGAMRPPLYFELLDIPDQLRGLERRLGIEPGGETKPPSSAAERRETPHGSMWLARNTRSAGKNASSPQSAHVLFTLPNGFPAVAAFAPEGRRLDSGSSGLTAMITSHLVSAWIGKSCLGCAAGAPQDTDTAAAFRLADNLQYRSSLMRADVDPDLTLRGLEIIAALARRWTDDAGFHRIAAELGESAETLAMRFNGLPASDRRLARRSRQGLISREEANVLMARLENPQGVQPDAASSVKSVRDEVRLTLWSDQPSYRLGDRPLFEIETNTACNLTLISVNSRGFATVLLPNDFERETLISPERPFQMPNVSAPYDLRFIEKGREAIIAICEKRPDFSRRIRHRFVIQHFTSLGKWRDFFAEAAAAPTRGTERRDQAAKSNGQGTSTTPGAGRAAIAFDVRD